MSDTSLRWIDEDDPLMRRANDLRYEILYAPFAVSREDMWKVRGDDARHLVAVRGGIPIGYGCVIFADGGAQIRQLCVHPLYRGRGVGRKLLCELVHAAGEAAAAPVWLNARVPYAGFYERGGFEVVGGEFASGGTGLPHVRMELQGTPSGE